jgi:hypothetical protein
MSSRILRPYPDSGRSFGDGRFARALRRVNCGRDCYTVVKQLASELHCYYKSKGPPFAPSFFANLLNIPVFFANIEAEGVLTTRAALRLYKDNENAASVPHGFFEDDRDMGPRILLRVIEKGEPTCSIYRRNFTLAHEIGHYILRQEVSPVMKKFVQQDAEEEHFCNVFAEELLMPEFALTVDLQKRGLGPRGLLDLSDAYEVSLSALLCRVTRISKGAAVAIMWHQVDDRLPVISWSTPFRFRRAILCDTGKTPIELAFSASETQVGRCDLILDGERSRWEVAALRLAGSNKVLSILRHRTDLGDLREARAPNKTCNSSQLRLSFECYEEPKRIRRKKPVRAESFPSITLNAAS